MNYKTGDLFAALFTSEAKRTYREKCISFFKNFFKVDNAVLVSSGRDGLYELLVRLPQKKVIIPAYTCIAVEEAVRLAKKKIVYSPTDDGTYNSEYKVCLQIL